MGQVWIYTDDGLLGYLGAIGRPIDRDRALIGILTS